MVGVVIEHEADFARKWALRAEFVQESYSENHLSFCLNMGPKLHDQNRPADDPRYQALMDAARAVLALGLDDERKTCDRTDLLEAHDLLRAAMLELEPTGLAPLSDL